MSPSRTPKVGLPCCGQRATIRSGTPTPSVGMMRLTSSRVCVFGTPTAETGSKWSKLGRGVGLRDMRDLTVADTHTYYVIAGDTPVLVHNNNLVNFGCGKATSAATWVDEGGFQNSTPPAPSTQGGWFRYQSAAPGARSNLATGRAQVPQYSAPDGNGGVVTAKFDTAFGDEAIDRKLGLTGYGKDEAERQVAVASHHGFQAVYELPSQKKVDQANALLASWGVTGIQTRVGSW